MTAARKKTADDSLTVGLAQIAPIWLNREKTLAKMEAPAWRDPTESG